MDPNQILDEFEKANWTDKSEKDLRAAFVRSLNIPDSDIAGRGKTNLLESTQKYLDDCKFDIPHNLSLMPKAKAEDDYQGPYFRLRLIGSSFYAWARAKPNQHPGGARIFPASNYNGQHDIDRHLQTLEVNLHSLTTGYYQHKHQVAVTAFVLFSECGKKHESSNMAGTNCEHLCSETIFLCFLDAIICIRLLNKSNMTTSNKPNA
jgi:hypothetical protein